MKLPKKFSLFIFFSLFLATILSVISCRFDLLNAESEKELEEALSNEVHFYSCEEGGAAAPVVITKRFPIGIRHNSSDFLSGSELSRLSGGGTFLGYKFYRMTESGSTVRPSYVQVNSDEYITTSFVSVDEMDFVIDWGVNYCVNHFLQNTDGLTYPSTPYLSQTLSVHAGENSNAIALSGSDIAGFTYDASSSDPLVQNVASDGSTVINLYYTRNLIYLTINLNGGNIGGNYANATLSGRYGASTASEIEANLPTNPVQTGKYFAGWEPPLPATFPAGDASYSAVWSSSLYNVAFNSNGGSGTMATLTNRVYETEYTLPANTFTKATSDGTAYQFNGWNTQADGNGTDYADEQSVNALTSVHNSTVTLYAQWKAPYKVNHKFEEKHSGGGSLRYYTRRTEIKYAVPGENTAAEALSADDELMPGYELSGTISQQPVSADGTTAIDINYRLKQITLTFNLNGGNIGGDTSKTANVTETGYYNFTNIIKAGTQGGATLASGWQDDVEWEGRTFSGWLDSETGGVITTLPEKFPPADKTYTAQWDIETYTLTFVRNGGTWSSYLTTVPESYTVESAVTLPVNTAGIKYILRTGYDFAGWYENEALTGDAVTSTSGAIGNKTYYAKWTPTEYTITYELHGGTNDALNRTMYTIIMADFGFWPATRSDYDFGGWYTDLTNEATKVEVIPRGSFGNKTLHAKWTASSYNILYETNGGTWADGYTKPNSYTVEDTKTLPTGTNISKTGYTFAGWFENSGLTGDAVTTTAGASGAKTYYAKWTPIEYTITYELDGGTNADSNPATYTIESADITLADATKTDYQFDGWYTDLDDATTKVETIESGSTENKTLYAKWLPIYATVNGTKYYTLDTAKTAIQETEGVVNVVLYSAAKIGKSSDESSITYAMRNPNENCTEIHVSIASGEHVTVERATSACGFQNCTKLVSVDLSGLVNSDSHPCNSLNCLFSGCTALTSISFDFTTFDTSTIVSVGEMFKGCSSLTILDLTGMNTSAVEGITGAGTAGFISMFQGCTNLSSIIGISSFNTSSSVSFSGMFSGCSSLTTLDLSSWDTSNVEVMKNMFSGCSALTSVNISGFDTSKVTDFSYMFNRCSSLTSVNLLNFDTSNATTFQYMFQECSAITSLNLNSFSSASATNINYMFIGCTNLTTIYATTNFDCSSVTNKTSTFARCNNLHGGADTTWSNSNTSGVYARIDGGTSNPGYFTGIIGAKAKPDAVGDIVFKDGSATAYTSGMTLSNNQKSAAIAVIFYKGSSSDSLGAKTLGIGLKKSESTLAWAASDTTGETTNFTELQCTDSTTEPATGVSYGTYSVFVAPNYVDHYVTGDSDGSDNWSIIQSQDSAGSSSENAPTNYPAWDWVNNYATVSGSHVAGTIFATGWYMPTAREILESNLGSDTVRENVGQALSAIGGDNFSITNFWTSSQDSETANKVYYYNIGHNGGMTSITKTSTYTVRAIHRF